MLWAASWSRRESGARDVRGDICHRRLFVRTGYSAHGLGAAIFGAYWGFLYVWIGAMIGASAAFWIGRTLAESLPLP